MAPPESLEDQLRRIAGDIASLEGYGKPMKDLGSVEDPGWWAKKYVRRSRALDRADDLAGRLPAMIAGIRMIADPAEKLDAIDQLRSEIAQINADLDPAERIVPPEV